MKLFQTLIVLLSIMMINVKVKLIHFLRIQVKLNHQIL